MDLSFLPGFAAPDLVLVLLIFIFFIIVARKAIKVVMNIAIIAVVSGIFPFVMNNVLGFPLSTELTSVLFFVTLGIGLYLVYILGKIIYGFLGIVERSVKAASFPLGLMKKKSRERTERKMEYIVKEHEDEKKKYNFRKKDE